MINFDRVHTKEAFAVKESDAVDPHPFKNWENVIRAYQRNQKELRKIAQYKPSKDKPDNWEKSEAKLLADQFRLVEVASKLPINDNHSALYALLLWEFENKEMEGYEDTYPLIEAVKNFIKTQA